MKFSPKKVALVLRDNTLRQILQLIISGSASYKVTASYPGYEHLVSIAQDVQPDLVIMDLQFDETSNGIHAIRKIKRTCSQCKILIFSGCKRSDMIFAAFKSGASGYILQEEEAYKDFLARLDELCNGGAPLSSEVSRVVVESFHTIIDSVLTRRETEILQLLADGKTYREVSEALAISRETSKAHIRNIYAKLEVNSKHEAIAKGIEKRIVYHPHANNLVWSSAPVKLGISPRPTVHG